MAINGCLTLAWLEEDDPSRGFFRVLTGGADCTGIKGICSRWRVWR